MEGSAEMGIARPSDGNVAMWYDQSTYQAPA